MFHAGECEPDPDDGLTESDDYEQSVSFSEVPCIDRPGTAAGVDGAVLGRVLLPRSKSPKSPRSFEERTNEDHRRARL